MSTEFNEERPTQPDARMPLNGSGGVDGAGNDLMSGNVLDGDVGSVGAYLPGNDKGKTKSKGNLTKRIPLGEPEKPLDKAGRVQFIIELMAGNRWVTGITGPKLAYMWNLSVESLKKDAAEASRFFLTSNEDREELKKRWRAKLEAAQDAAMEKGRLEALSSLLKLEGDNLGVFEAQKVDVTVTGSDEQLAARIAALVASGGETVVPEQPDNGREETA